MRVSIRELCSALARWQSIGRIGDRLRLSRRLVTLLVVLSPLNTNAIAQGSSPHFFEAADEPSSDEVWSILQLADGRMVLGTSAGLIVIGGIEDEHILTSPLDVNNANLYVRVKQLVQHPETGNLFVGTDNMGVLELDAKEFSILKHYMAGDEGLRHPAIYHIEFDGEGMLWVITEPGGVERINPQTGIIDRLGKSAKEPRPLTHISTGGLHAGPNGSMWIFTKGGGVSVFDIELQTFRPIRIADSTSVLSHITSAANGSDGFVYLGAGAKGNKIGEVEGGAIIKVDPRTLLVRETSRTEFPVRALHTSSDGQLFAWQNCLVEVSSVPRLVQGDCETHYDKHWRVHMVEDHRGDLWILSPDYRATLSSLFRYSRTSKRVERIESSSLPGRLVSIASTSTGGVWFGSFDKGAYQASQWNFGRLQWRHSFVEGRDLVATIDSTVMVFSALEETIRVFRMSDGKELSSIAVDGLLPTEHPTVLGLYIGQLILATSAGLYVGDAVDSWPKALAQTTAGYHITAVISRGNDIVVGTADNGVRWLNDGSMSSYFPQGEGPRRVSALVEDRRGQLWVGSYNNGLYKSRMDEPHELLEVDTTLIIRAMFAFEESDEILIATGNNGLFRLTSESDKVQSVEEARDLLVTSFTGAGPHQVWMQAGEHFYIYDSGKGSFARIQLPVDEVSDTGMSHVTVAGDSVFVVSGMSGIYLARVGTFARRGSNKLVLFASLFVIAVGLLAMWRWARGSEETLSHARSGTPVDTLTAELPIVSERSKALCAEIDKIIEKGIKNDTFREDWAKESIVVESLKDGKQSYNPKYLSDLYSQVRGITVKAKVRRQRMEQARTWIESGEKTPKAVSQFFGVEPITIRRWLQDLEQE